MIKLSKLMKLFAKISMVLFLFINLFLPSILFADISTTTLSTLTDEQKIALSNRLSEMNNDALNALKVKTQTETEVLGAGSPTVVSTTDGSGVGILKTTQPIPTLDPKSLNPIPPVSGSGGNSPITPITTFGALQVTPQTQQTPTASTNGNNYTPLQPVKLPNGQPLYSPNITEYLNNIFSFGIAIAGALAVIMMVIGGIKYMLSDAFTNKEDAKEQITSAVKGLLLALVSYVILYTINPDLVNLRFNISSVTIQQPTTPGVIGPGAGPVMTNSQNFVTKTDADGNLTISPTRVAIDTDGTGNPGFYDSTRQTQTAYQVGGKSLDATTQDYVVVPQGSNIPLGTKVVMTNRDTGQTVTGIVGDVGPANNGYGEISLHAAQQLGAWSAPMGNSAKQVNIDYKFVTGK